ncbi:MAG: hypothetical protein ACREXW_17505 [Gammaproteobacteria bacterium]
MALLVGHHRRPLKVCEAAVRLPALAQAPARILRGLTLHSGEASLVPVAAGLSPGTGGTPTTPPTVPSGRPMTIS